MALDMKIVAQVKPGSVTCNFADFKEMLREELETNYKSIIVSEEYLQQARDGRATLNKAKQGLAAQVRSIKAENNLTIEKALEQAKELDTLLDDAISTLDGQIKRIEERQRDERMNKAKDVLAQKISNTKDEKLIDFCVDCYDWLVNPKWANAGTSFKQIYEECEEKIERCRQALELLSEGDYAAQMLAEFQRSGDLAQAQILGKKLEAESRKMADMVTPVPESKQTNIPNKEIKLDYNEPIEKRSVMVKAPAAYRVDEKSDRTCRADFRIRGQRYVLEWFMDVCKQFNISLERLDK